MRQIKFDVFLGDEAIAIDLIYERDTLSRVRDWLKARGQAGLQVEPIYDNDSNLLSKPIIGYMAGQYLFSVDPWTVGEDKPQYDGRGS